MMALKGGVSTISISFSINTKIYLETVKPKVKNESQFLEFHVSTSVLTRWIWPFTITVLKISFINAYSNLSSLLRKSHIKKYLKLLAEVQENNLAWGK